MPCCVIQGGGIEGNSILQNGSSDNILTPEQAGVVLGR
jgi:hypothetical protein